MLTKTFHFELRITPLENTMFTTTGNKQIAKHVAILEWTDPEFGYSRLITTSQLDLEKHGFSEVMKSLKRTSKLMKNNILFNEDQTDLFNGHEQ